MSTTAKSTRRLTLGQLVSWASGKMFCTWGELTEVAEFMLGRPVNTLCLNLHADRIRDELIRQHPILSTITALDRETARLPLDADTQSFVDAGVTVHWSEEDARRESNEAVRDTYSRLTACGCNVGTGTHCIHGAMPGVAAGMMPRLGVRHSAN